MVDHVLNMFKALCSILRAHRVDRAHMESQCQFIKSS